jgi:diguanylate cyclase (GGDEF)-like protein/PAS domain S-box-containing protein
MRGYVAVVLVAILGSASVGTGAWYWHSRNVVETRAGIRTASDEVSGDITEVLLKYGDLVSGSAALFHQGNVSRAQYADYLQAVGFGPSRFPGLLGLGYVQRVTPEQLPGFFASLHADGIAASLLPLGRQSQYCLGSYADWTDIHVTVPIYGYDFCTLPAISQVLGRASASGRQQVLLGSAISPTYGADFLLVRPVYSGSPASAAARERQVRGWVVAVNDGQGLVKSVVADPGLQFALYSDATDARGGPEPVLLSSPSVKTGGAWFLSTNIDADGPWTVRFRATAGLRQPGDGQAGPITLLVVGLLAVGLFVALLASLLTGRSRAERAVERATRSLQTSEERFRRLVANSSDVMAIVNDKAELLSANPAAERILGVVLAEATGRNVFDIIHPDDRERVLAAFTSGLARPGLHEANVFRARTGSGDWRVLEVVATNCLGDHAIGGIVLNAHDVTERTNLTRALRTLGQGNQVLVHASDEVSLLADTCRTIVEAGGYLLAWVGYVEHDDACTVRPVASAGRTEYMDGLHVTWGHGEPAQGPVGTAIRTATVQVVDDTHRSREFRLWRAAADKCGFRTVCSLPLRVGGGVIGALSIYAAEPGAFDPEAVNLLCDLADDLAYGIGHIRDAHLLQASEERFRTLAGAAPIGILEVSEGGAIDYANPKMAEISGRNIESLAGLGWAGAVHPDDLAELLALIERVPADRGEVTARFRIRHAGGEVRHVRMSAAPKSQEVRSGYVASIEDITEEVQAQDKLTHQAFYDALTGLPNRALFLDRLDQELVSRGRNGSNIAVLFLDLDHFKFVNDSLGHELGDAVLKEVGSRLSHAVRAGETVARFSGDSFVFIIKDVQEVGDAVAAAKRLLGTLASPVRCGAHDLTVTVSIGIVVPGPAADAVTVLRDADTAMYKAKAAGRDRYELFDEDLHRRSVARLAVERDLRDALVHKELEVYYQPVLEPGNGRPIGAEALVRWHHPKRGLVSPVEFIPVAEDSGLIRPIGRWVFEQAVEQLAAWDGQDDAPALNVLSVNLSARQLDDEGTPGMVREVLERCGAISNRLSFEVTESAVMADSAATRRSLESFKELGAQVAIDDFGTGYSSLAYLHTLPVTTLKVDRCFVERLGSADDSMPVVRAIVDMGHAMGLNIVAEGVSSEHLRELVAALGCDAAQGFHWSPPLPAAQFVDWWREATRLAAAAPSPADKRQPLRLSAL